MKKSKKNQQKNMGDIWKPLEKQSWEEKTRMLMKGQAKRLEQKEQQLFPPKATALVKKTFVFPTIKPIPSPSIK